MLYVDFFYKYYIISNVDTSKKFKVVIFVEKNNTYANKGNKNKNSNSDDSKKLKAMQTFTESLDKKFSGIYNKGQQQKDKLEKLDSSYDSVAKDEREILLNLISEIKKIKFNKKLKKSEISQERENVKKELESKFVAALKNIKAKFLESEKTSKSTMNNCRQKTEKEEKVMEQLKNKVDKLSEKNSGLENKKNLSELEEKIDENEILFKEFEDLVKDLNQRFSSLKSIAKTYITLLLELKRQLTGKKNVLVDKKDIEKIIMNKFSAKKRSILWFRSKAVKDANNLLSALNPILDFLCPKRLST